MTLGRCNASRDDGETLVEILITVVVLAITVTALIGGITLGIVGSDTHRRLSDVEVVARAYGEQVQDFAAHQQSTSLTADTAVGDTTIKVASSAGFPSSTNFTAAVDGEVVEVTKIVGTTWTVTALQDAHSSGGSVQMYLFYDAVNGTCPTTAAFTLSTFTAPAVSATVGKIKTPTITSIEYYDSKGQSVASGSTCDNYWKTTGTPCNGFNSSSQPHETQCDIDLVRLTISAVSVDAGTQRGATTTTRMLIRRGNS